MDDAGYGNKSLSILDIGNKIVPVHDREMLWGSTPVKLGEFLVERLLHLLHSTLLGPIVRESLKIMGEAQLIPHSNTPLGSSTGWTLQSGSFETILYQFHRVCQDPGDRRV